MCALDTHTQLVVHTYPYTAISIMNARYLQIIDFRHFWVGLEGPEIKFSSTKMMARQRWWQFGTFFRLKKRFSSSLAFFRSWQRACVCMYLGNRSRMPTPESAPSVTSIDGDIRACYRSFGRFQTGQKFR